MPLDWGEVYINTVELMASLALQDWNSELGREAQEVCAGPLFTTQIVVRSLLPWIENKYLVWGLYQAGLQIGQRHASQHSKLHAGIVLHGRPIGFFSFEPRQPGLVNYPANSTLLTEGTYFANTTSKASARHSSALLVKATIGFLTANRGTVTDPLDNKLKITYEFDGVKISPNHIFTAYLDAFATAAIHDSEETGASIVAYSEDRHVSITVRRDVSYTDFTWGELVRALLVIWDQLIVGYGSLGRNARWEGMSFLIEDDGNLIGEGFLVYYRRPPRAVAVSR